MAKVENEEKREERRGREGGREGWDKNEFLKKFKKLGAN